MPPRNILVIQTAFIGDVILTLPLVQSLRKMFRDAKLSFLAIPSAAGVLFDHPDLNEVITYDKKGKEKDIRSLFRLIGKMRDRHFDVALVPHRSLRSAALARFAKIPTRIGFSTSGAKFLFSRVVDYKSEEHETKRNLHLMQGLDLDVPGVELPRIYPSDADKKWAEGIIEGSSDAAHVAVAPGSVWNTKRWPMEQYRQLVSMLVAEGIKVILLGSKEDALLCEQVANGLGHQVLSVAGRATLLQSAAVMRRCRAVVSNDSAPMHLAVAVGTPVVAVFGATVPAFGFGPLGPQDVVVETHGLACRPCSIHGGDACPIKTFVCMNTISSSAVYEKVISIITGVRTYA